jgi:hypothetical protein
MLAIALERTHLELALLPQIAANKAPYTVSLPFGMDPGAPSAGVITKHRVHAVGPVLDGRIYRGDTLRPLPVESPYTYTPRDRDGAQCRGIPQRRCDPRPGRQPLRDDYQRRRIERGCGLQAGYNRKVLFPEQPGGSRPSLNTIEKSDGFGRSL